MTFEAVTKSEREAVNARLREGVADDSIEFLYQGDGGTVAFLPTHAAKVSVFNDGKILVEIGSTQ